VGRVDFIRDLGLNYRDMEQEENGMIAVIEASARYKAPARYDDEVVRANDELLLCEGETTHIIVDRNMKKREMPEKYATLFRDILYHAHEKK
jgi:acyl-CoA thioester hydrolase